MRLIKVLQLNANIQEILPLDKTEDLTIKIVISN
jgi:hypothetical protein